MRQRQQQQQQQQQQRQVLLFAQRLSQNLWLISWCQRTSVFFVLLPFAADKTLAAVAAVVVVVAAAAMMVAKTTI